MSLRKGNSLIEDICWCYISIYVHCITSTGNHYSMVLRYFYMINRAVMWNSIFPIIERAIIFIDIYWLFFSHSNDLFIIWYCSTIWFLIRIFVHCLFLYKLIYLIFIQSAAYTLANCIQPLTISSNVNSMNSTTTILSFVSF